MGLLEILVVNTTWPHDVANNVVGLTFVSLYCSVRGTPPEAPSLALFWLLSCLSCVQVKLCATVVCRQLLCYTVWRSIIYPFSTIHDASRLSLIWMGGGLTFTHVCVDSSQTVLEYYRSFAPFISVLIWHAYTRAPQTLPFCVFEAV